MNAEYQLEFHKIKEKWADLALTQAAKNRIQATAPIMNENELRKAQRKTTQSRELIEKCGNPPLPCLDGIDEIITIIHTGDCLTPDKLEKVAQMISSVTRIKDYLRLGMQYQIPLAFYEENLVSLEELREEIEMQIRNGEVIDQASKQLSTIRAEIARYETKMRDAADTVLRANKAYLADNFCTYKNGRLCVPVKKEYKGKVAGAIIDKSSTGSTLFIEPSKVASYFDTIAALRIDEENEVYQILYTLTAVVFDSIESMKTNVSTIENLDYHFSKGKLSIELDATAPEINTDRVIELTDARHPLMDKQICVPLQFKIGGDIRGIIITGPNTGGKTVSIKTVALNCMMAQCGLHVTCGKANICMNSNYLCDIGDGQNMSENLSTFSAHITNVLSILEVINKESLVIMDELGSGTDPTEGMGIAISIIEELKNSGCLFLLTTHYPEVKEYALNTPHIQNARMTFDKNTLKPQYKMIIGEAGESCAIHIARRLGMPLHMLETATEYAYHENIPDGLSTMLKDYAEHQEKACGTDNMVHTPPKGFSKIQKSKTVTKDLSLSEKFHVGDSVMVYPDKKIGIIYKPIDENGMVVVQLRDKKITMSHKRVKLHVAASELYPEDYDFSIIFDSVEARKKHHDMSRKYVENEELHL